MKRNIKNNGTIYMCMNNVTVNEILSFSLVGQLFFNIRVVMIYITVFKLF